MAHILAYPIFRGTDADGNPLAGGKLYTYQAGSSTPQATYTDRSEGEANTNPIILNSRGEARVWLKDSWNYKFILTDADDVLIWSEDNIAHLNDLSISTSKLANGALANSTDGRLKMADGYLSASSDGLAKMAAGYFQANSDALAKFADGFFSNSDAARAKFANGFLSADSAGRALMADGFVTPAKMAARSYNIVNTGIDSLTTNYITKATCTLTTTGRPVLVMAQVGLVLANSSETAAIVTMLLTRSNITLLNPLEYKTVTSGTVATEVRSPLYAVLDVPPAGSTTYLFSAKKDSSADSSELYVTLSAVEL